MSRHSMLIAGLSLGLVLSILTVIGLFKLIAVETEKIEAQRMIQFERRASEIRADIEYRRALLEKRWESDRKQVFNEGMKLAGSFDNTKDHANQIGQWLTNLDGNYRSEEADLIIEEAGKIAELREQIWANDMSQSCLSSHAIRGLLLISLVGSEELGTGTAASARRMRCVQGELQ